MRSVSNFGGGIVLSVTVLAGCGGGTPSNTGSTPTPTPTYTAGAQYAYVGTGNGFIDEYSISTTGQWTEFGHAVGAPG